jgi:hypothetical protein
MESAHYQRDQQGWEIQRFAVAFSGAMLEKEVITLPGSAD